MYMSYMISCMLFCTIDYYNNNAWQSQVVGLMEWVMPKPSPAEKLERVGWVEEEQSGPPWKHMRALSKREKKVQKSWFISCRWTCALIPEPAHHVARS